MSLGASFAFAQSDAESFESVTGALSVEALSAKFEVYHDINWDAEIEDFQKDNAPRFTPINMSEPDFGYVDNRIWLRARLKNDTLSDSVWRLYVRENFLQYYSVYMVRDSGQVEPIENHTPKTKFSERLMNYPELVTPIKFEPGESITLYIAYWSEGSSNAAISLETSDSFAQMAVARTSKNYIFYGMIGLLIITAFLGLVILRRKVFAAYLIYVFLTLLYLMHVDGVTFQYFWPSHPRFNSYFTIIIGTAFVLATYNFARIFLDTRRYHPFADSVLFWMGAATPFITIPGAVFDPQLTKQIIMPLILLAILAGTVVGLIAARERFKLVRFYLFAWMFGIISAGIMNMRHVLGFDISQDTEFDSIRISMVVDSIMMGLAVVDGYIQTQRQREKATRENLKSAKQNLKLNQRLFDLEEQYNLAEEMAITRDENLKNTIHDLRQPLHALRLNIQKSSGSIQRSTEESEQIGEMFSYLETLLTTQLETAVSSPPTPSGTTAQPKIEATDTPMRAQKILKSVHEMFLPDALEKGLTFRFIPSRHDATVNAFILIRILNNLVSNAIKYTPSGKVLIGSRRMKDHLRIEVHDTGIGMNEADFKAAKLRHVRLDEGLPHADGRGLGLSIAAHLAAQNGYRLSRARNRKNGTSLYLEIPVKPES